MKLLSRIFGHGGQKEKGPTGCRQQGLSTHNHTKVSAMKHDATVFDSRQQKWADTDGHKQTAVDGDGEFSAADIGWLNLRIQKGEKKVFAEMVDLTPGLASALLSINEGNRSLKSSKVPAYAKDMESGRWQFNGETMSVSRCGFLNDGQNRCHAVIRSGVTIPVMIVFGVDRESRRTTDQGCPKGAGDYLQMGGVHNPNNLAGIAKMVLHYEEFRKFTVPSSEAPTKSEVTERVESDEMIEGSFRAIRNRRASKVAPPRLIAACHYICAEKDREAADVFFEKLVMGVDLRSRRDPIYVAREKLTNPLHRLNVNEKAKTILSAWNNWRRNKEVRSIVHSIKRGEALPEVI